MKAVVISVIMCTALFCISGQEPEPQAVETGSAPAVQTPEIGVQDCIMIALLNNREIMEEYLEYRKTENDLMINRSDFLPKIDLEYEYSDQDLESTGTDTREDSSSIVYSQSIRLLAFLWCGLGPDADRIIVGRCRFTRTGCGATGL